MSTTDVKAAPDATSVVVAIDVGTARSGVAYAFVKSPRMIYADQSWGGSASLKTRTALLLSPDQKLVAFGEAATQKYLAMETDAQQAHLYFDHFKLALYEGQESVKARNGQSVAVVDVFAHAITFLKTYVLDRLKALSTNGVEMEDIRWVVTVPAIWSNAAKTTMRAASTKAGLPSDKIMIALESEAAALCCRSQELKLADRLRQEGAKFVVLDLGGGTADLTSHKVRKDQKVDEAYQSDGNDCGSWKVDKAFCRWLEDAFGKRRVDDYRASCPSDFLDLQNAFETAKHATSLASIDATDCYRVQLPHSFMAHFAPAAAQLSSHHVWPPPIPHISNHISPPSVSAADHKAPKTDNANGATPAAPGGPPSQAKMDNNNSEAGKNFEVEGCPPPQAKMENSGAGKNFGENNSGAGRNLGVEGWLGGGAEGLDSRAWVQRGVLRLSRGMMLGFFQPLLRELEAKVDTVLAAVKPAYLFVVGGFAENDLVWSIMQACAMKRGVCPVRPARPSLAVLTGAVQFGLEPTLISSRIMKMTYGVAVSCEYREPKHSDRARTFRPNNGHSTAFCDGIFSPFVLMGDVCPLNHAVSQVYTPGEDEQDCMVLKLYQSTSKTPTYVDAPDAKKIGSMTVPMPNPKGNIARQVCVTLLFGATEITAHAKDVTSGEEKSIRIAFDNNFDD